MSTSLSDDKSSLRISLLLFVAYVVAGMLVYRHLEGWSWITCIYFSATVLTTVGYGDPVPTTPAAKLFTAFYAIVGIAMLAGAVGVLGGAALEKLQDAVDDDDDDGDADEGDDNDGEGRDGDSDDGRDDEDARHAAKEAQQKRKRQQANRRHLRQLAFAGLLLTSLIGFGTVFYAEYEDLDYVDSLYMSVITLTTVGFGDVSPQGEVGRLVGIFWIVLGTVATGNVIGQTVGIVLEKRQGALADRMMEQALSRNTFLEMDVDHDGEVSEIEYVCGMLQKLGKVSSSDISRCRKQYRSLLRKSRAAAGAEGGARKNTLTTRDVGRRPSVLGSFSAEDGGDRGGHTMKIGATFMHG